MNVHQLVSCITTIIQRVSGLSIVSVQEFRARESVEMASDRAYYADMNALPPLPVMEQAVRERDSSFDGAFFTAVRTTGVFCRPSCPAKTPLARNREYYPSA